MNHDNDKLYRFSFDDLPVRGQWVRLNETMQQALSNHSYPEPIDALLGEMFAAVAMFADNLKFAGAITLQSSGQGRVIRTLAECRNQSDLRGLVQLRDAPDADLNKKDLNEKNSNETLTLKAPLHNLRHWLGEGATLALSLIPEEATQQAYQGLVELGDAHLQSDLEHYFDVSEQLPTKLFLAAQGGAGAHVTGLLLQRLPSPDLATEIELAQHEEGWQTVCHLADTITSAELSTLGVTQLLHRLFHELPCRVQAPRDMQFRCTCSRQKTDATLHMLGAEELRAILTEQGSVEVACELCGCDYTYDEIDVEQLIQSGPNQPASDALH